MEKNDIFFHRRRKTEEKKEENILREKIYFCGPEEKLTWKRKENRRKIFGERIKIFNGDVADGKGKGGKYPEKENTFCRGEEEQRRKRKNGWTEIEGPSRGFSGSKKESLQSCL